MNRFLSPGRRGLVGSLAAVAAGSGLPFTPAQAADASLPAAMAKALDAIAAAAKLSPRQRRALEIRVLAALDGVRGTTTPAPLPKSPDDKLRPVQFSKALRRTGDPADRDPSLPDLAAFTTYRQVLDRVFQRALAADDSSASHSFDDVEALAALIGSADANPDTKFKWTNPLGGVGYDVEGLDPPYTSLGPPHVFDPVKEFSSAETAAQMAEVYWLALLRDTNLADLDPASPPVAGSDLRAAWDDLNAFTWYGTAGVGKTPWNRLFRADLRTPLHPTRYGFEGVEQGPFLSQFLFTGTAEKDGPNESAGVVSIGTLRLSQKQKRATANTDYLNSPQPVSVDRSYLAVQNGSRTAIGGDAFAPDLRFISTLRDGASYVHFDEIYQEYFIAASILLSRIPRVGNTLAGNAANAVPTDSGRLPTQVSESSALPDEMLNIGNPYRGAKAQVGFATFGVTHILTLLAEVATRAHKAAWYHKWSLRWLRPEEFGGRIHYGLTSGRPYPIHQDLLSSVDPASGRQILSRVAARNETANNKPVYLLPMAYPEGCPTHPARPSGHSTVAGASTTILKGLFNGYFPLAGDTAPVPVLAPARDGGALEQHHDQSLSINGELNKLASNVSLFRMIGGVHWRGDSISGMLLGEQIGVHMLVEQSQPIRRSDGSVRTHFYGEVKGSQPFFRVKLFGGDVIDIRNGRIHTVKEGDPRFLERWQVDTTSMSFPEFVSWMY